MDAGAFGRGRGGSGLLRAGTRREQRKGSLHRNRGPDEELLGRLANRRKGLDGIRRDWKEVHLGKETDRQADREVCV